MSNTKSREKKEWSEAVERKLLPHEAIEPPLAISLVIPVCDCAESIGATLESVARQEYEPLEVIIIDAGSKDHTLEIVNSYTSIVSRIYTVAKFNLADMCNRGISLASGKYITFLFPGSYYLSDYTYQTVALAATQHNLPDLTYFGSIQRELMRPPHTIFLPFEKQVLEKGDKPATMPGCFFRRDLFERIGKFNPRFLIRPGFEFFCRVACEEGLRIQQIDRIFVDFDYGRFSYGKALRFSRETWRALYSHFGLRKALAWYFSINQIALAKSIWITAMHRLFQK